MGTTALVLVLAGQWVVIFLIMKFFLLSSLLSLSVAAPAPEAEAAHVLPVLAHHVAVVPAKQLQWPGITAPGVDKTCFGCRPAVAVAVGRKRREAEAVADATAEADAAAEAEPVAEAAAAPLFPLAVAPHYPYHVPAVAFKSVGYATVNHPGASYSTGVHAVHVLPLGRRRRGAEAEAEPEAEAEAEGEAEADPIAIAPVTALNGYIHNLGSGNSYSAISTGPSLPYVHVVAAHPYAFLG